ncbi:16S rRNA (uracil(1498)-N(3))-methyltransferase [Rhodosalinus sp.]|uniref:16S rRNA (uracil(1498)-N(3))-methyltransferase n=1 Tax=Rhodosalinus sp. TaxID=2047741 RepID=UPI0039787EF5
MVSRVRLFVEHPLAESARLPLERAQAHYLFNVMRLSEGDKIAVFDGGSGEWAARVIEAGKRGGTLECLSQSAPQRDPPDVWLLFAPVKKARTDFIVEKAVEMGARRLVPVQTDFTNSERIRRDRLQAHAVEAAEQCGATFVPEVAELSPLSRVLNDWPEGRALLYADEAQAGRASPLAGLLACDDARQGGGAPPPAALLIGPEGGLSAAERARLASLRLAAPLALGPRILRADTAAVAALALWQAACGDWR